MRVRRSFLIALIKTGPVVFLILVSLKLAVSKSYRRDFFSYFSTRCIDYRQAGYSKKLNDRLADYGEAAKRSGIIPCKNEKDLRQRIRSGSLVKVKSSRRYTVDKLSHSHPYVTEDTRELIDEIGRRFREKTSEKGLRGSKFIITSMTRKTDGLKSLRKANMNASENSPHLYGNAFDITYKRILADKMVLTNCDKGFLKEALAEVIWELRAEKKCWATYERGQACFHVVAR
ncbi:MAG: DUF5715 family protein [Bacteroidales bacterium]|jgi:hypothetical protein|nr:DUF5715 family protein [Bacteroidales bacterium]MCU0407436.1 DUF5715 family protein [Bacteroidales bacterium]